ncbi:MAG: hypothetical protein V3R58_08490 [candidate division NC10 bacterium]
MPDHTAAHRRRTKRSDRRKRKVEELRREGGKMRGPTDAQLKRATKRAKARKK